MKKAIFLIDGFNLYHSLTNPGNYPAPLDNYKWLNLYKMAEVLKQPQDILTSVIYFTSLCTWDDLKRERHTLFIRALKHYNVEVVLGKFKEVERTCRAICKKTFKTFVEKQTDVNIAIYLLSLAFRNKFDNIYLMSGDSDLIPAVKEIKKLFTDKKIILVLPPGQFASELRENCDSIIQIKEHHLASCQMENIITNKYGKVIACPEEWI